MLFLLLLQNHTPSSLSLSFTFYLESLLVVSVPPAEWIGGKLETGIAKILFFACYGDVWSHCGRQ